MIQDLASQIIDQFATNLSKQIEGDQLTSPGNSGDDADIPSDGSAHAEAPSAPVQPAAPAQVGGMAFKVLWNQIIRSIKELFVRKG